MIIKFSDDATEATFGAILAGLSDWTIEVEYNSPGLPSPAVIENVKRDYVVVLEADEFGRPIVNSRFRVGYDEFKSITIL
jgi:hypothetical protein